MDKEIIKLTGEKELRIFMHPLRQKILRTMRLDGTPMTAKQLADRLGITPSSAKHHLTQLESIGIIGLHHTEMIHGINATFYSVLPVTISIGLDDEDRLEERLAVSQNLWINAFDGFKERCGEYSKKRDRGCFAGDILTGVIHIRQEDADALYETILRMIDTHETAEEGTVPFEYALLLYRAEDRTK